MSSERRLLKLLRPFRLLFALSLLAGFLGSLLDGFTLILLVPLLRTLFGSAGSIAVAESTRLEEFIDWLVGPLLADASPVGAAVRVLTLFLAAIVLKNLFLYLAAYWRVVIEEGLARNLRTSLFDHIMRLDLGYFQSTRQGQLVASLVADVEETKLVVSSSMARFFQNAFLILVSLAALTQVSLKLTLITLATAPILVLGIAQLLKRLRAHARDRVSERGDVTSTIAERIAAIKLIRAYGEEQRESREFARQAESFRKKVVRTQRYLLVMSPVSELFGALVLVLLILVGSRPELIGLSLNPEVIVVFLVAALRMMSPIKQISQFPAEIGMAMASAERLFAVLDQPQGDRDLPGELDPTFSRSVAYRNVAFSYSPDEPLVLDQISFELLKGSVLAIVGPSGAGKSTLVDLLPRFHDPISGTIEIDGVATTRLKRSGIRDLLGVVSQETVLLNDTVYANILIGDQAASREAVEQAAEAANALDFINELPRGFDTLLGERGTRLSGGQRQRIAIARALLRDPPILILDEATSALDPQSERLVQQAIDRLMKDRTVMVIAHRLSTVRNADQVIVLDRGRLVEQGTHDELYHRGGLYHRLYDLQFSDMPAPSVSGSPAGQAR